MSFLLKWLVSSLGLFIAAALLGADRINFGGHNRVISIIIAGFILALINTFIKPLLVIFSLPFIVFSLGLFMIVVNGLLVLLASWLSGSLYVRDLWVAMVVGMVVGLVNYLVVRVVEE